MWLTVLARYTPPMGRQVVVASGLVLSRCNVGEADRLLTLLTQQEGVVRAVAHGVRKLTSRRAGHTEPLTAVTAVLRRGEGRTHVAAIETTHYFSALHRDAEAVQRAQVIAGGVVTLFGEGEAQPDAYALVRDAWRRLPGLVPARRALLEAVAVLQLLRAAGVFPDLSACRRCGYRVSDQLFFLEPTGGTMLCDGCATQTRLIALSPAALKVARLVAARPAEVGRVVVPAAAAELLSEPWRRYLRWHQGRRAVPWQTGYGTMRGYDVGTV